MAGANPAITDKRGYAARWHFSVRTVDNMLSRGLPHVKIGRRRVRIIVEDADAWMVQRFGTQRRSSTLLAGRHATAQQLSDHTEPANTK
jgi:hypothetical protein